MILFDEDTNSLPLRRRTSEEKEVEWSCRSRAVNRLCSCVDSTYFVRVLVSNNKLRPPNRKKSPARLDLLLGDAKVRPKSLLLSRHQLGMFALLVTIIRSIHSVARVLSQQAKRRMVGLLLPTS